MKIKLTGALPAELKDLGFESGQIYQAYPSVNTLIGAVEIRKYRGGELVIGTVFPENYIKL